MSQLTRTAVRGAAWSALSTLLNRGARFLITIVLARLLFPADFGLVAMGQLVMDVAELLNDLGLGAALIQRKQLDPEHVDTCFWANLLLGAGLCLAVIFAAPAVAAFYRTPAVQPVLSVMALNFLLAPVGSVPWVLLNRALRFKDLMIAQTLATVVRGATTLALAAAGAGVWSLVWGPLAGTVTGSLVNWRACHWRPRLRWSPRHFQDLFRFGRNVFGEKLLGYFSANSDYIITGRFLGAATLGYYNFAYQLAHLAQTHLAPMINRVLFPVLSQVQDERARLRRGYLESVRWITAIAAPFTVGLLVVAPEFVLTVYGARWAPVVAPLQLLCAAGLVHAMTTNVWTVQQAVGRPEIGFRWNLATLPLLLIALLAGARWGVLGIAATMLAASVVLSAAIQHVTNRLIQLSWAAYFKTVGPLVVAAAIMGGLVAAARPALFGAGLAGVALLGAEGILGAVSYVAVCRWLAPDLWPAGRRLLTHLGAR